MPQLDKPLHELREYAGINPKPADHDAYWAQALKELDETDPQVEMVPVNIGKCNFEVFNMGPNCRL